MGRFKIKQGDGSFKKVAWKDEVDNIAGSGRTTETVKANADDIKNLQDNKVDKIEGKSLISDIEIQRLAGIDNYDDTLVMDDIENLQTDKVDKVDGKGLSTNDYTNEEKDKLLGISDEATKVESSTTNGNIKINGTETKVYNDTEIVNKIGDLMGLKTSIGTTKPSDTVFWLDTTPE